MQAPPHVLFICRDSPRLLACKRKSKPGIYSMPMSQPSVPKPRNSATFLSLTWWFSWQSHQIHTAVPTLKRAPPSTLTTTWQPLDLFRPPRDGKTNGNDEKSSFGRFPTSCSVVEQHQMPTSSLTYRTNIHPLFIGFCSLSFSTMMHH